MAIRNFFDRSLEQSRFVSRLDDLIVGDSCFVHARSGFGVQPFERNVEPGQEVEQIVIKIGFERGAQHGVAKHAGRERLQMPEALFLQAVRCFAEVEPLELLRKFGVITHVAALPGHPFEQRTRAGSNGVKIGQKKRNVVLPRNLPERCQINPNRCIGVARLPAGSAAVVIGRIGRIPSPDDVAEAVAVGQPVEKLLSADDLTPQNAVDIGKSELDSGRVELVDVVDDGWLIHAVNVIFRSAKGTKICRTGWRNISHDSGTGLAMLDHTPDFWLHLPAPGTGAG